MWQKPARDSPIDVPQARPRQVAVRHGLEALQNLQPRQPGSCLATAPTTLSPNPAPRTPSSAALALQRHDFVLLQDQARQGACVGQHVGRLVVAAHGAGGGGEGLGIGYKIALVALKSRISHAGGEVLQDEEVAQVHLVVPVVHAAALERRLARVGSNEAGSGVKVSHADALPLELRLCEAGQQGGGHLGQVHCLESLLQRQLDP